MGQLWFLWWKHGKTMIFMVNKWENYDFYGENMGKLWLTMIFMVKKWENYDLYGENMGKLWLTMIFMVKTWEHYDLYGENMGKLWFISWTHVKNDGTTMIYMGTFGETLWFIWGTVYDIFGNNRTYLGDIYI